MEKQYALKLNYGDEVIEKSTSIVWKVCKVEIADDPAFVIIYIFDEDDSDLHVLLHTEIK